MVSEEKKSVRAEVDVSQVIDSFQPFVVVSGSPTIVRVLPLVQVSPLCESIKMLSDGSLADVDFGSDIVGKPRLCPVPMKDIKDLLHPIRDYHVLLSFIGISKDISHERARCRPPLLI